MSLPRARQLLLDAATLDLDRRRMLVRCRFASFTDWWELDQVLQLLAFASDVCEVSEDGETQLVVTDGLDVYRFEVS